ncbi:MAG: hypothetical protein J7M18_06155 [Candidatus Eremiobacteraeota bacterium]|nr:hypothetical protein [Candidatus Eremiobacteraeota bacterium]
MKKSLVVVLIIGVMLVGICSLAYATTTKINYYITPFTKLLWEERIVSHFPDVAYVHVERGVEKFGIHLKTDAPGPVCLQIIAPNNQCVYDLYDFSEPPHTLGKDFRASEYGTGRYTIRVYHANTAPLTYTLVLSGPLNPICGPCD